MRRFYLAEIAYPKRPAYMGRQIVEVTADGMTMEREVAKGIDRVERWAWVMADTIAEARRKFLAGEIGGRLS